MLQKYCSTKVKPPVSDNPKIMSCLGGCLQEEVASERRSLTRT